MPSICTVTAAFLATLSAFSISVPPAAAQSPTEEVTAAYAAWNAAFNAGDAKAVAAAYTADALLLPPNHAVIEGPEGVAAFFETIFGMGATDHGLELIEADGEGDVIVAAARWSATGKDANGAPAPWGGVATHVFERQDDGSLKLRLHTFN